MAFSQKAVPRQVLDVVVSVFVSGAKCCALVVDVVVAAVLGVAVVVVVVVVIVGIVMDVPIDSSAAEIE